MEVANERKGGANERKLQRNVLLLGVVSLLNDLSSEMIMPILPEFIRSLASPGEASIAIGLVGGFQESISSVLKAPAGYISDKLRRRKIFSPLATSFPQFSNSSSLSLVSGSTHSHS